ncbi:MAG: extracellular solute-binding protein [Cyanobacteriota bacterium]|nr:extracellular solute-binding protein [Cyanobacteriota bacterium]
MSGGPLAAAGRRALPALLALAALCGGCQGPTARLLPVNLQVAISVGAGAGSQAQKSLMELTSQVAAEYMRNNPGVNLHMRFLPEAELEGTVRRRTELGAGPDLLISRVVAAARLDRDGLVTATGLGLQELAPLQLRHLDRFRRGRSVAALPFLMQPSLACFNRRQVPEPPRRIGDIERLAAGGVRIGLPLEVQELLWTASDFRADQPLMRLLHRIQGMDDGGVTSPQDRERLLSWLAWLARSNVQPNVIYVDTMDELVGRLENGSLDWISCTATAIPRLRRALGPRLAVSPLPGTDDGSPARALARLIVISFGRDSSGAERAAARKFALFMLNDYSQNNLMVRAVGNLPANRNVIVPTKDSPELAAMLTSLRDSISLPFEAGPGATPATQERLVYLIKQNVYGEWAPPRVLADLERLADRRTTP